MSDFIDISEAIGLKQKAEKFTPKDKKFTSINKEKPLNLTLNKPKSLEPVVIKKQLQKSKPVDFEEAEWKEMDEGIDKDFESQGSKKAALANLGLQMAGMKTDSAAGGGISGGLQAASMTGNPYIIAGAAVLGAVQGESQRRAQEKKLQAEALLAGAQAQSTAASQKQKAMAQMGQAFQRYFS